MKKWREHKGKTMSLFISGVVHLSLSVLFGILIELNNSGCSRPLLSILHIITLHVGFNCMYWSVYMIIKDYWEHKDELAIASFLTSGCLSPVILCSMAQSIIIEKTCKADVSFWLRILFWILNLTYSLIFIGAMVIFTLYSIDQFKSRRLHLREEMMYRNRGLSMIPSRFPYSNPKPQLASSVTIIKQLKKEIKHCKGLQESTIVDALRHTIFENNFDEHIIACTILFAKYTFHFHPSMIAPETRHAIEQERIEIAMQPDPQISNIDDRLMLPYRLISPAGAIVDRITDCYLCAQMFERGDMLTAMVRCHSVCHTECLAKYFTAKKTCKACNSDRTLAYELKSNVANEAYTTNEGNLMIPKISMASLFERHIYVPNNRRLRIDIDQ